MIIHNDDPYYDSEPEVLYTFVPIPSDDKPDHFERFEKFLAGEPFFAPISTYNDVHKSTIFVRSTKGEDSVASQKAESRIREWLKSRVVRCFTTDPTNTLMWAHYTKSHTGVCIGFKFESLKKTMVGDHPLRHSPIRYSSVPPLCLTSDPEDPDLETGYLAYDVLNTKSIHWAYEKEHRIFLLNPEMAATKGESITVGADAVAEVIFGAEVKQETIDKW